MVIASLSQVNLKNRRQELRNQRRWQAVQGLWRFLFISSVTVGVSVAMALPQWDLSEAQQVEIEGNELMTQDKIRSLLSLSYPQSLWLLKVDELKEKLEKLPPIAQAKITRQILPTKITISIKERQPVALATSRGKSGYLDQEGFFLEQSFYSGKIEQKKLLPLKVIGFEPQYGEYWRELYPEIGKSAVKIVEIDWRNPSNLILKTELGKVQFGAYEQEFPEKLAVLGRMKQLSGKVPLERIVYVDITNPQFPSVKLKPQPPKSPSDKVVKAQ